MSGLCTVCTVFTGKRLVGSPTSPSSVRSRDYMQPGQVASYMAGAYGWSAAAGGGCWRCTTGGLLLAVCCWRYVAGRYAEWTAGCSSEFRAQ